MAAAAAAAAVGLVRWASELSDPWGGGVGGPQPESWQLYDQAPLLG